MTMQPSSYHLAFGFITWPFFYAGLGLMSIPVIIHILNRRRFKVVTWAAMDYLLRAMRKNRKRLKFEQWILLATRCLLIFLLAFALARPLAGCSRDSLGSAFGGRAGLNVFVIDNSYSTSYEAPRPGAGRTHLDQEKLIAKRLIDQLNSGGESVAIIAAARPATAIIAKPGYDLNAAKAAIDRLEQSYAATDLAGALQLAAQVARDDNRSPSKSLYLLTDGTKSAWEGAQADAIRRIGPELAKLYRVSHFNMTEGRSQWNQAVLDVYPDGNLVTNKYETQLLASIKGFGPGPEAVPQWTLDGSPFGTAGKSVRLDPSTDPQPQTLQPKDVKSGGPHVVTVSLGGEHGGADPLPIDNKRYRVLDVASEMKVLIVEGTRGTNVLEGSGAFLQLALAPARSDEPGDAAGSKSDNYIAAELVSDLELRDKVLTQYRAVVLAGVGQITEPEADRLQQFVQGGGTLLLFMGEPVSKENYNSVLLPRKLMPGAMVKLVESGENGEGFNFDFKPTSVVHPFLKAFAKQEKTGLDTAKVYTYWEVDVPPDSRAERVLNYVPGKDKTGVQTSGAPGVGGPPDPAVTVHPLGEGRVVFVSTTADPRWTSFPAKMAYVELMNEILAGGVRAGDYWMNLTVGQPLEVPPEVKLTAAPELKDDAGTSILIDPTGEPGKPTVYRSRALTKPGLYSLNLGNGTVPIAVNVPADEADVRTIGNEAVRKALGDVDLSLQNDELPSETALSEDKNDWAGPALLAVLALLAVECFMAMSFGHYRRSDVVRA